MLKRLKLSEFIIAVVAVIVVTVVICVSVISCSSAKLKFNADYYFICYRITDNGVSASSLSGTVSSYGGAGYILYHNENYYVTVACYYSGDDAEAVCEGLKKRDFDCTVLNVSKDDYPLSSYHAKQNGQLFLGNLNTLHSLSVLAYDCANELDTGGFSQNQAKEVISSIKSGLNGLLKANSQNCFTDRLNYLLAECEDKENGFILSKDMRFIQIAICDSVLKAELY